MKISKMTNEENKEEKGRPPYKKIRVGNVTATIWDKELEGKDYKVYSVKVEKNYKDGETWKTTNNYNTNDLPKLCLAVKEAYKKKKKKED